MAWDKNYYDDRYNASVGQMSLNKKVLLVCPKCGSSNIFYCRLREIRTNPNTQEVLSENWVEDFELGHEPRWEPCADCGLHFDEPAEITAYFDEEGNLVYRDDMATKGLQLNAYTTLYSFENEMREFIEDEMEKRFGEKWWDQRVPQDVKETAQTNLSRNSPVMPRSKPREKGKKQLIDYINFSDFAKIIARRDNWRDLFKDFFRKQDEVNVWLGEINPIRNNIMHSREISVQQYEVLKNTTNKLRRHISRTEG